MSLVGLQLYWGLLITIAVLKDKHFDYSKRFIITVNVYDNEKTEFKDR